MDRDRTSRSVDGRERKDARRDPVGSEVTTAEPARCPGFLQGSPGRGTLTRILGRCCSGSASVTQRLLSNMANNAKHIRWNSIAQSISRQIARNQMHKSHVAFIGHELT